MHPLKRFAHLERRLRTDASRMVPRKKKTVIHNFRPRRAINGGKKRAQATDAWRGGRQFALARSKTLSLARLLACLSRGDAKRASALLVCARGVLIFARHR